ncbi:MAG: hypothetical protein OXG68_11540 [Chloroflexi bacterium]|nr:hypothetical protein [Chloroflexota bacterium]
MSKSWWTLILESYDPERRCMGADCRYVCLAPLAQRETPDELLDIIPLLDEQEETSDFFRFVQGHTEKPERVLRYDDVIRLLSDEQHPD